MGNKTIDNSAKSNNTNMINNIKKVNSNFTFAFLSFSSPIEYLSDTNEKTILFSNALISDYKEKNVDLYKNIFIINSISDFILFINSDIYKDNVKISTSSSKIIKCIIFDTPYKQLYFSKLLEPYVNNNLKIKFMVDSIRLDYIYKQKKVAKKQVYEYVKNGKNITTLNLDFDFKDNTNITNVDDLYLPSFLYNVKVNPFSFVYSITFLLYNISSVENQIYLNLANIITDKELISFLRERAKKSLKSSIHISTFMDYVKEMVKNKSYLECKDLCTNIKIAKLNNKPINLDALSTKYDIHIQIVSALSRKIGKLIKTNVASS